MSENAPLVCNLACSSSPDYGLLLFFCLFVFLYDDCSLTPAMIFNNEYRTAHNKYNSDFTHLLPGFSNQAFFKRYHMSKCAAIMTITPAVIQP